MSYPILLAGAFVALGVLSAAHPARAETYHTCAGFIDSVPATISTQGVWCLRRDLSTGIASGAAITVATNNVTIDCNGFKLGGLAAGSGSDAHGIRAITRQNVTVRNCSVRGFLNGVRLSGGGHLVEDNRFDNNLQTGISVSGENNRISRNAIYDTGGRTTSSFAFGIDARAEISDNVVSGLLADAPGGALTGIRATGAGVQVRNNSVSGFVLTAAKGGDVASFRGIHLQGSQQRASGNHVTSGASSDVSGSGIHSSVSPSFCQGNAVGGFTTNIHASCLSSGNLVTP